MTETFTEPGVVPDEAETTSQLPVLDGVTVYARLAPPPLIVRGCDGGAEPPAMKLKVNEVGDADTVGGAVMVNVTGISTVLPPFGVIRMLPLYVPTDKEFELTLTVKGFNGVAPEVTFVESQLPPLVVVGAIVKVIPEAPEALDTETFCAAGLDPCCEVKVREVGDTVTFPVLPLELLTVNVTGTF